MKPKPPPIPLGKYDGPVAVFHIETPAKVWISLTEPQDKVLLKSDILICSYVKLNPVINRTF